MHETATPLPQYALMACCSVKAQGQLYLYLFEVLVDVFVVVYNQTSAPQSRVSKGL
jgi:hypothetical protein